MREIVGRLLSFIDRYNIQILWLIVILVILAGSIYAIYLGNELRFLPDEPDYINIARHLAFDRIFSLDGKVPTAYRPPGYPWLISFLVIIGAEVVHVRVLNYLILALCIVVVHRTIKEKYSPLGATIAAVLVLCYPIIFFTAGVLYPQTLATLFFLLSINLLTRDRKTMWSYILGGFFIGFLILTVPTFIFTLVIFGVWLWFTEKFQGLKGYFFAIIIALVMLGFWTVRNYAVFDTLFFVSTNSGENLLLGNSENTTPNGGRTVDISKYLKEASEYSEVERDRYFREQALSYIQTHKLQTMRMYILKLLNHFNFSNELVTQAESSSAKDIIMLLTYGPLLILFFLRIITAKRFEISSFEILLISLYFVNAFVSAVFFTRIRFRLPFDFLLLMIAAIFLSKVILDPVKQIDIVPSAE